MLTQSDKRPQWPKANNESSEICGIIKPSRRVKLNRSQTVNVHKLLTIRYLLTARAVIVSIDKLISLVKRIAKIERDLHQQFDGARFTKQTYNNFYPKFLVNQS